MKTTLLIIYNKLIYRICRLFKRDGSVFPGSLVKKHDKNISCYKAADFTDIFGKRVWAGCERTRGGRN